MGLKTCIKIVLLSALIIHSIYLVIWAFSPKPTRHEYLEILGKSLNRKQIYEHRISENLMNDKLDMSVTRKVTTDQKSMMQITLNPEVNLLLNITFSRLKPPSLDGINYLLEDKSICDADNLSVVIMFHSKPAHFDKRKAIRETWANTRRYSSMAQIRTIFIMGRFKNATLQALIEEEFMEYSDIIQGNFVDGYRNLSLNSLYGYKWINQNCANAKYVMKADDDIVVNMNKLLHAVNKKLIFMKGTREVACFRVRGSVHKNKTSRFYVGEHVFMNTRLTLPFCEGKFVFMTTELIAGLLDSASITPLFWIEDVYWYGFVMSNIQDIIYTRINWEDKIEYDKYKAVDCLNKTESCKFFITWADHADEIRYIYSLMESKDKYKYTEDDFINATVLQDVLLLT